jgi:type III pantothenate kinase
VIVADFGTALTFDVISKERAYIGGVIAPGLSLMFDYLAEKTALLPHLSPAAISSRVGRSTEEAMLIGAHDGYRGMVSGILAGLQREVGECSVCATGGYAEWVLEEGAEQIKIMPDLTLLGLGLIYELNRAQFTPHRA